MRRVPYMDLLGFAFDIWQFKGEDKEAQLMEKYNKIQAETRHDRANTRLWI
ncbi:MAG: hypothetical protein U9N34_08335 [Candidatus Cloacimonadota bacterium]|nr:hypothetical protein [Candidatus Cloacimonadota bacterium]